MFSVVSSIDVPLVDYAVRVGAISTLATSVGRQRQSRPRRAASDRVRTYVDMHVPKFAVEKFDLVRSVLDIYDR